MNKVYISGYSNTQQYLNDRKVAHNEKAFDYDGNNMQLFENNNGKIMYERLSNRELANLLHVNYKKHSKDLLHRLKDDLLPSSKRRKTRKHNSKTKRKNKTKRKPKTRSKK